MSTPSAIGQRGHLTWLGHATVLFVSEAGTRVIFDPWLDNPKGTATLADVGALDVIAVTHGHFDHMASVVPLAAATGASVICVPEMAAYFASVGVANVTEMNKGGTVRVKELAFTMVGADHSCGVNVGEGLANAYGGNPVGFVVTPPAGEGAPFYVSGDTNVFGDMALIGQLYGPEVALIPIDGHYNMGPREAAHAVQLLGVKRVAPIHYGTFPMLAGTPEQLREALRLKAAAAVVVDVSPGESLSLAR
ncbi:MAG TPA: metal-dependent hydrolase [Acidimicrobiales bacterium]|nr:metal-dependent hydrolase [Acidimicrobiales bacterium]